MSDISNDPQGFKYTHLDVAPPCNYKPAECDCDPRQDLDPSDQIRSAAFVASYEGAVPHEAPRLRSQPYYRHRALLADSLKRILAQIDRSSLQGKRDYALLLMGFAGGLRASEMTRLAAGQFRNRLGSTGVPVEVRGKGSKRIVLISRGRSRDTDPLTSLHEWLAATNIPDEEALFQHISPDGGTASGEALSPVDVGRITRRRAADAGLDDPYLTAHSLRFGHQITMLVEGDVDL